jgi:5-keto 4-deoxyuronate isomerase
LNWYKGGFENIMLADFVFKNDNDFPVKDLTVECIHSAPSGTQIDQNTRTIYEVIPAHGTKSIQKFNMGFIHSQAERSSCHIKDYQLM